MTRIAFGLMAFLGLMLIFGTAGTSDLGNISTGQSVLQASIGLVLFATGVFAGRKL